MIDLSSDTATRPTPKMREAIARAEVGDEQRGEDPTTAALEKRAAELLGTERAMFLPTATMANAIAMQLHCGPGDEMLAAENGHTSCFEVGAPAVHARAMVRSLPTPSGIFTRAQIEERLRPPMVHCPRMRLIVVENTTNMGGGQPWDPTQLQEVRAAAQAHGFRLHCDGSRLLNAAVRLGVPPADLTRGFDTVTLCLTKGLGAPLGAVLGCTEELYPEVRRHKHMHGGALRQSGMMAAAGLYALEHHVERLAEDHRNAARLAEGLQALGFAVEPVDRRTNMVFFEVDDAAALQRRLEPHGLRFSQVSARRLRAVTHLDVSAEDIARALQILSR